MGIGRFYRVLDMIIHIFLLVFDMWMIFMSVKLLIETMSLDSVVFFGLVFAVLVVVAVWLCRELARLVNRFREGT